MYNGTMWNYAGVPANARYLKGYTGVKIMLRGHVYSSDQFMLEVLQSFPGLLRQN